MDSKQAAELLKKYWNCDTSLEEEQQLKEYFVSADLDDVPEGVKESSILFRYFAEQKKKSIHDISFESGIIDKVTKGSKSRGRMARLVYNSLRIAAGVLVVMASIWFVRSEIRKNSHEELVDTYDDPQQAFEETKKALLMISRSFGTAEEQAKKLNLFNEAQKEIEGKETKPEKKKDIKDS